MLTWTCGYRKNREYGFVSADYLFSGGSRCFYHCGCQGKSDKNRWSTLLVITWIFRVTILLFTRYHVFTGSMPLEYAFLIRLVRLLCTRKALNITRVRIEHNLLSIITFSAFRNPLEGMNQNTPHTSLAHLTGEDISFRWIVVDGGSNGGTGKCSENLNTVS